MAGAGFRLGLRTVFVVDLLVANGSGGNPLSRPQPPAAVAEGQSLQGIASRPNSATQSDVRRHFATTTIRRQHPHMQAWRGKDRQETSNFKPMIFSEFYAAGDMAATSRLHEVLSQGLVARRQRMTTEAGGTGVHCAFFFKR